jgi:hypothetical protein
MIKHHFHTSSSCGLHIHVSRRALGQAKWDRLKTFMYSATMARVLKRLSRREQFTYCNFQDNGQRYQALNLQPDNTAEFRLWAGTLNWKDFISSIETTMSLVDYSRHVPIEKPLSPSGWRKFVERRHYKIAREKIFEIFPVAGEARPQAITSEERAAQAARRLAARNRRELQAIRAYEHAVQVAGNRACGVRRFGPSSYYGFISPGGFLGTLPEGITTRQITIPVQLRGYNESIRRYAALHPRTVTLNITSDSPEPRRAVVTRSSGWGNYRYRVEFRQ